ncbi:MAG: hypothetical protein ACYDB3_01055 [Acidimicrobiales bacterium]
MGERPTHRDQGHAGQDCVLSVCAGRPLREDAEQFPARHPALVVQDVAGHDLGPALEVAWVFEVDPTLERPNPGLLDGVLGGVRFCTQT